MISAWIDSTILHSPLLRPGRVRRSYGGQGANAQLQECRTLRACGREGRCVPGALPKTTIAVQFPSEAPAAQQPRTGPMLPSSPLLYRLLPTIRGQDARRLSTLTRALSKKSVDGTDGGNGHRASTWSAHDVEFCGAIDGRTSSNYLPLLPRLPPPAPDDWPPSASFESSDHPKLPPEH
ncbi:hypothetical protein M433DRAFT_1606 [Acidomyces richmondensis BFW]|nr:MAG: hypothetical protein FE78DRAFT_28729 [Acidomyces sp. 'richmondensis']KYG48856.1 hypothetical protein M433DRAFT_1606 [Acidomyces richmondensis BFW]